VSTGRDKRAVSKYSRRNLHTRRFIPDRAYAGSLPWRTQSSKERGLTFRYAAASFEVIHSSAIAMMLSIFTFLPLGIFCCSAVPLGRSAFAQLHTGLSPHGRLVAHGMGGATAGAQRLGFGLAGDQRDRRV